MKRNRAKRLRKDANEEEKKYRLHHGKCDADTLRSLLMRRVLNRVGVGVGVGVEVGGCRCPVKPSMLRRFVTSLSRSSPEGDPHRPCDLRWSVVSQVSKDPPSEGGCGGGRDQASWSEL